MPVNATPTAPPSLTLEDVRMFMRDVAGRVPGTGVENILFDLPEFSDDDIRRAIRMTVARFNVMTPPSGDTEATINPWLLLTGVCEFLALSEAHRQVRNQATYPEGAGSPVGVDDKAQLYLGMANTMKVEFEEKAKLFKISRNMESAYGSLSSGYRYTGRMYE